MCAHVRTYVSVYIKLIHISQATTHNMYTPYIKQRISHHCWTG